jgi:hypothetical protein
VKINMKSLFSFAVLLFPCIAQATTTLAEFNANGSSPTGQSWALDSSGSGTAGSTLSSPYAWRLTGVTNGRSNYKKNIDYAKAIDAFNYGWTLTANVRITQSSLQAQYSGMSVMWQNDASTLHDFNWWGMDFGSNASGEPTVQFSDGTNNNASLYTVTGQANQYVEYKLTFDPISQTSSISVNGVTVRTGYTGRVAADAGVHRVYFGDNSTANTGKADFQHIDIKSNDVPKKQLSLNQISDILIWQGSNNAQGQYDSYCAFTDLEYYNGNYYVSFRESNTHVYGSDSGVGRYGRIGVIRSSDAVNWSRFADQTVANMDLRDPKLNIDPNGALMLNTTGAHYNSGAIDWRKHYYSKLHIPSDSFNPFSSSIGTVDADWLWRITWNPHDSIGYVVSKRDASLDLMIRSLMYKTSDAISFDDDVLLSYHLYPLTDLDPQVDETAVDFLDNGDMILVVRARQNALAWLGYLTASSNYQTVTWTPLKDSFNRHRKIGGPEILILEDNTILIAGRFYSDHTSPSKTLVGLAQITLDGKWIDLVEIPNLHTDAAHINEDVGYPGLKRVNNKIYMSYYAHNNVAPPDIRFATFNYQLYSEKIFAQHLNSSNPNIESWTPFKSGSGVYGTALTTPTPSWNITGSTSGLSIAEKTITPNTAKAIFNSGWTLKVKARVNGTSDIPDSGMTVVWQNDSFGATDLNWWGINLGSAANGNAIVEFYNDAASYTVPSSAGQFVDYELRFDPTTQTASIYVNGSQVSSGHTAVVMANAGVNRILFGDNSTPNTGNVDFAKVELIQN